MPKWYIIIYMDMNSMALSSLCKPFKNVIFFALSHFHFLDWQQMFLPKASVMSFTSHCLLILGTPSGDYSICFTPLSGTALISEDWINEEGLHHHTFWRFLPVYKAKAFPTLWCSPTDVPGALSCAVARKVGGNESTSSLYATVQSCHLPWAQWRV